VSRRLEIASVYGMLLLFLGGGVVAIALALFADVPGKLFGFGGLGLIALSVGLMAWSESKVAPPPDLIGCICDPEFQRDEASKFPDLHRPACPIRKRWEQKRRNGDCGCGPPVPKQNYADPRR
jgi:hypothetical protein